jgi:hypothetical protein
MASDTRYQRIGASFMKRYQFTGHLSPRPPGTERAMCELSGEVYLAAEVQAELQTRERAHEREITRLNSIIVKHLATIKRLRDRLAETVSGAQ